MPLKFLRYTMTGGAAAIVDLVCFRLLLTLGSPIASAAVLSWLIAAVVNYSLTSRVVFNRPGSVGHGVFFALVATIGIGVNVSITLLCATQIGIDPILSKFIGIGVAFILNFWLNVLVVFK
jgi:putative flippase GtrA